MSELIIGHTTHHSVRIWVRATREIRDRLQAAGKVIAFVRLRRSGDGGLQEKTETLTARTDFSGVLDFEELAPAREHTCELAFGARSGCAPQERVAAAFDRGRFRTFPKRGESLEFLLGSCNTRHKHSDSSFSRIADLAEATGASFMIHCGDQIYYPEGKDPALARYREQYRRTWRRDPVRKLFTRLPHYMILDDHEIRNNFRNDRRAVRTESGHFEMSAFKRPARQAYWEYQHSHNPHSHGAKLYYEFSHGSIRFFVMDVRSERWESKGQMVSPAQLADLLGWLKRFPDDIKFVVTPVPFVADAIQDTSKSPGRDKWCAQAFDGQRREVLRFLCEEPGLRPPVFLTGDMHNSYHAVMRLMRGSKSIKLHELMSSPINQKKTSLGKRERYLLGERCAGPDSWQYTVGFSSDRRGERYFSSPNVMRISVGESKVRFWIHPTGPDAGKAAARQGGFQL